MKERKKPLHHHQILQGLRLMLKTRATNETLTLMFSFSLKPDRNDKKANIMFENTNRPSRREEK